MSEKTTTQDAATTGGATKPPPATQRGPIFLLLGGTSSMMAATCTHPLDLLKVRLQTAHQAAPGTAPRGLVQTAVALVHNEGFRALYRGLTASLGRQGTYSTTRFAERVFACVAA
ncbi:hypothetical protein PTSG_10498 [Salpingoeca rosetta]|uniref:Uncharacterized protein n=1 Tax=Salpingoeca rosetta (strain ATCC 50818 / BSB-021) TaxID=946362 RepID=F2UPU6_SALR5|nr:uncharacterized protein PTSG_10498 [Salpingoeca rosetta]EGD79651.1 hypothetical protein PTSG_10498 [Salpingoeca rosetta]|eukprot:XP_004988879.1 hypothetical protein PTSG_10498 [Salpingoeca rosetta]